MDVAGWPRQSGTMSYAAPAPPTGLRDLVPRRAREFAAGFGYWLAFLLVLEPGNILRSLPHGGLDWDQEVLRITAASLLGASVTPAILALARRHPIEGPRRWRRAGLHLAAWVGLAAILIVASCVAAEWLLERERQPLAKAVADHLVLNGPLLVFCLAGLDGIAHAAHFFRRTKAPTTQQAPPPYLSRVPVKTRGRMQVVELDQVDWIESQGNYLALHCGPDVHLIRETSRRLETQLDPQRFARIHRRTIVALDRIRGVRWLSGGDGVVHLRDGAKLRLSRGFRAQLRGDFAKA